MDWIDKHGQMVGWGLFLLAFLIMMLAPQAVWLALLLYALAGPLFGVVILRRWQRRRRS
jgi:hypothetical protein